MSFVSISYCSIPLPALSIAAIMALTPVPAAANLLVNGDFETGVLSPWSGAGGTAIDSSIAHDGTSAASLGTVLSEPATLQQAVGTTPGTDYTLTFFVLDQAISAFDSLTVSFGTFSAVISGDLAFDPAGTNFFASESFSIPGSAITAATTTLLFSVVNDLAAFSIDDVVLTAGGTQPPPPPPTVPEPAAALLLAPMLAMLGGLRLSRRRR